MHGASTADALRRVRDLTAGRAPPTDTCEHDAPRTAYWHDLARTDVSIGAPRDANRNHRDAGAMLDMLLDGTPQPPRYDSGPATRRSLARDRPLTPARPPARRSPFRAALRARPNAPTECSQGSKLAERARHGRCVLVVSTDLGMHNERARPFLALDPV